jgi:hypothetical protein
MIRHRPELLTMCISVFAVATPAAAQVKATFLDGTYVMSADACEKLKRLAQGGPRSASTVPWRVDRDGFHYWEGGCGFTRIIERRKGREWQVTARCAEGPDKSIESYTFVRSADGTFAVTLKGEKQPRRYSRCEAEKRK